MENVITVRCDAEGCSWEAQEDIVEAKRWHNAPCPKCSHEPVLSDADMEILNATLALRDMGLAYIGGGEVPTDKEYLDVRLNTRSLRRAAK